MAQTAAVKQSKANARAQKQLGHNTWRKAFMQHYWLYIMMLPALLYMIIFNYLPMTGLYMAFTDFSPFNGDTILECVFGSPFAGLKYFKKLFTGPDFWTLFRNTLSISLANLLNSLPHTSFFLAEGNPITLRTRRHSTRRAVIPFSYGRTPRSWRTACPGRTASKYARSFPMPRP